MSDDEELRRAFAKEMGEDADDESSDDEGTSYNENPSFIAGSLRGS